MKDDQILKQYLLGSLNAEQADNLERRLLLESDLFELAEAVEGDLLLAAARGELSPAERGRVLRRLASSPEGRARYALIRGLTTYGREKLPTEVLVFQLLSRPVFRAAAAAACLAFAAGGFWLASQTAMPRGADIIARGLPSASEPRTASPEPALPPVDQVAQQPSEPSPVVVPSRPTPASWILELALTSTRSAEETQARLKIPPGTRQVEIRLPLLPGEPSTSFAAILRNAVTGAEIRHAERLAAKDVNGQKMVILSVPAADLAPGTYEVEVRGFAKDEDELLGRPMFEIASN
jgi:hypothetical protein